MSAPMLAYEDASAHSTASALGGLDSSAPAPSPAAAAEPFTWTAGTVRARPPEHSCAQLCAVAGRQEHVSGSTG